MTDTAAELLAAFESLPEREQHELLAAMLRVRRELPETIVSDEQLVLLAEQLFESLDAEEVPGDGGKSCGGVAC